MPLSAHIEDKWVDIVPPGVPVHSVETLTIVVSATLLVALIALGILFYRRPRQRAKRALRRLAHDLHRSQVDIKTACFQVKRCLRDGFGQRRLQFININQDNQGNWQSYLNRLTKCCFAAEPPTVAELDSVIHEALAWLNKKAVNT